MEIKTAQEKITEAEREIFEIIDRLQCITDLSVNDVGCTTVVIQSSSGSSRTVIIKIHLDIRL